MLEKQFDCRQNFLVLGDAVASSWSRMKALAYVIFRKLINVFQTKLELISFGLGI